MVKLFMIVLKKKKHFNHLSLVILFSYKNKKEILTFARF